jgi:hypothetical protein
MLRQANLYEKKLFEIIRDLNKNFYYESIFIVIDEERYKIHVEKNKEEMVGHANIALSSGNRIEYELRYNRITNIKEGYTLIVPGAIAG